MERLLKRILSILLILIASVAEAQLLPRNFTIEGRLFDNSGIPYNSQIDVRFEVLVQSGTCVLYRETHSNIDVSSTEADIIGRFALRLGSGTTNFLATNAGSFTGVFTSQSMTGDSDGNNTADCNITPSVGTHREVRISVSPAGAGSYSVLSPNTLITSVPGALVADTLQGLAPSAFLQADTLTAQLSQANLQNVFSSVNYPKLTALLNGTSTEYMLSAPTTSTSFNNQRITNLADPSVPTDASTKNYSDSNIGGRLVDMTGVGAGTGNGRSLIWDAGNNRWITGDPTASDPTKLPLAGGTMSGDILMGTNSIQNTGYISMAPSRYLQVSNVTSANQTTMIGSLNSGHSGALWYNSTDGAFKYWDGSSVQELSGGGGGGAGDIEEVTAGFGLTGGGTTGAVSLAVDPATVILNGGNSSASSLTIGTNDSFNLNFETGGIARVTVMNDGRVGIGTIAPQPGAVLDVFGNTTLNSSIIIPRATTPQRPATPVAGMLRYNITTQRFEGYENGMWVDMRTDFSLFSLDDLNDAYVPGGLNSVYLGVNAGTAATGIENTGVGDSTLGSLVFGSGNTAMGYRAMVAADSASQNTAIGNFSLAANDAGSNNVVLGSEAGRQGTSVENSVFIGVQAGELINGSDNIFIGYRAGNDSGIGNGNIVIGSDAQTPTPTSSNTLNIGDTIFGNLTTKRLKIGDDGTLTTGAGFEVDTTGTGGSSILIPRDTMANRPTTPVNGMMRYNTDIQRFEIYENGSWKNMSTSSAGAFGEIQLNDGGTGFSSDPAFVFGGGQLGIGTAFPGQKIDIMFSESNANGIRIFNFDSNPNAAARIETRTLAGGTQLIHMDNVGEITGALYTDAQVLRLEAQNANGSMTFRTGLPSQERMHINAAGAVSFKGNVTEKVHDNGAISTVDWDLGTIQTTSDTCAGTMTLNSMRNGGTYTLFVTSTNTMQCTFASTTMVDGSPEAITYRFMPFNSTRNSGTHTKYQFTRVNGVVYVTWQSGY